MGCVLWDFTCKKMQRNLQEQCIHIYMEFKKRNGIKSHKLSCFVCLAVPFNGGECCPGMLHSLDWHICSCYAPSEVRKLHLLVIFLMTVLKPESKLFLNVTSFRVFLLKCKEKKLNTFKNDVAITAKRRTRVCLVQLTNHHLISNHLLSTLIQIYHPN